jgi:hypothetical protein
MTRALGAFVVLAIAATAHAQVDGGAPPPGDMALAPADGGVSQAEIENALKADVAVQKQAQARDVAAATVGGSQQAPQTGFSAAFGRIMQSLNPDISAIIDFAAGWYGDDLGTIKSGDDPQLTGFNVQEIEVALQAVVDPYFRADVFLTVPNLQNFEVEEAFLTTTHLPANLQLKAGIFRAGIGRQNGQHLHMQDFTRRPTLNPQFLGVDGLRSPGMELNWLVPRLPFYLVLAYSMFSVAPAEVDQPLQTFGGGARWDFTYLATARAFFPLSDSMSLLAGLNYAHGKTSQRVTGNQALPSTVESVTIYDNYYDNLYGADLYLKWKPPNQARSYASVQWQSEYFLRQIPNLLIGGVTHPQLEGGLYSQVVVQTHRRWFLGLRGEVEGIPEGDNVKHQYAAETSVTWALSEFSRIRLYGEVRYGPRFLPENTLAQQPRWTGAAFLQMEAAIGAHGAHPF